MIVALVYIGRSVPSYVFANLKYLIRQFPDQQMVFISDNKLALKKAAKIGITTWFTLQGSPGSDLAQQLTNLPMNFRDGFWYKTVSRFYALEDFSRSRPELSVLQVESDVWLSPNFPFDKIQKLECDLAFPLEKGSTGAGSIVFLRNYCAAKKLAQIMRDDFESVPNITDMGILGRIASDGRMNVQILPSTPFNSGSETCVNEALANASSAQAIEYFGGVFDPVTYGLYLIGEDSRNHRGFLYQFRNQKEHLVTPSQLKFSVNSGVIKFVDQPNLSLFNIHNHSKIKKIWRKNYQRFLSHQVEKSKNGPTRKFQPLVFAQSAFGALKRRML